MWPCLALVNKMPIMARVCASDQKPRSLIGRQTPPVVPAASLRSRRCGRGSNSTNASAACARLLAAKNALMNPKEIPAKMFLISFSHC